MIIKPESFTEHPDAISYIQEELPPLVVRLSTLAIGRVGAVEGLQESSISHRTDLTHIGDIEFVALSYDSQATHSAFYQDKQEQRLNDLRQQRDKEGLDACDAEHLAELEAYKKRADKDRVGSKVAAKLAISQIYLDTKNKTLKRLVVEDAEVTPNVVDFIYPPTSNYASTVSLLGYDGLLTINDQGELSITPDIWQQDTAEGIEAIRRIIPSALVRLIDVFNQSQDEDIAVKLPVTL